MMSEKLDREYIESVVQDVVNQEETINVLLATQALLAAGCAFIGTSDPNPVPSYDPLSRHVYRDLRFGIDVYAEETPSLQLQWSGKIAIMAALFGDINQPKQREQLGIPIVPAGALYGTNYGWRSCEPDLIGTEDGIPYYSANEEDIVPHADRRLISCLHRKPETMGYIEILPRPEDAEIVHGIINDKVEYTRQGIWSTQVTLPTIARLPVRAQDIYLIGIEKREPKDYERTLLD